MNLTEYVKVKYKNDTQWFVEEVASFPNQSRIQSVIANKDYLAGHHDILKRPNYKYNGQVVEPRRIVLNLAKQILNFQNAYLLKNGVTITGQEDIAKKFNEVSKTGKYFLHNQKVLDRMLKFGECAEYVYMEKGKIKSKVIDPSEYTPVFNRHNQLISLIEHYVFDGIQYYTVYDEEKVQEWSNEGGRMVLITQHASLTGLPVLYVLDGEYGNTDARSDLDNWKTILDQMEDIVSRYTDNFYKFMQPIPVMVGQQLKSSLDKEIVGQGINLDDGADFKMVSPKTDSASFKILFNTLQQSLLDISSTPAVSMGKSDISNLSEVSIKLLFSLADVAAGINETFLKRGLFDRYEKIRTLLEYQGFTMTNESFYSIDFVFEYNLPANQKEIIDNLKTLREIGGYSVESLIEKNPYVKDASMELDRLAKEGVTTDDTEGVNPLVE